MVTKTNLERLELELSNYYKRNPEPQGWEFERIPLHLWSVDMFATFVINCVLTCGDKSNLEFNEIVNLDFANDTNLYKYSDEIGLPSGPEYDKYQTVRSFLYDVWNQYRKELLF